MPAAWACSTSLIWLVAPLARSAKIRRAPRPGPTSWTRCVQEPAGALIPISGVPAATMELMEVPAVVVVELAEDPDRSGAGRAKLGASRPGPATMDAPATPAAPPNRRKT